MNKNNIIPLMENLMKSQGWITLIEVIEEGDKKQLSERLLSYRYKNMEERNIDMDKLGLLNWIMALPKDIIDRSKTPPKTETEEVYE